MKVLEKYISLNLKIRDNKIDKIFDLTTSKELKSFFKPLTENKYKLYVLKKGYEFLYVGITKQSLRNRLRFGFNAKGENGYHGYKWKDLINVKLFVWTFQNYTETQLENIEAELAYLIRKKTNNWPLYQNEIHFNNKFEKGKEIAKKIFELIKEQ
jgi:predicted GIY-YIG superfamily endonuclease